MCAHPPLMAYNSYVVLFNAASPVPLAAFKTDGARIEALAFAQPPSPAAPSGAPSAESGASSPADDAGTVPLPPAPLYFIDSHRDLFAVDVAALIARASGGGGAAPGALTTARATAAEPLMENVTHADARAEGSEAGEAGEATTSGNEAKVATDDEGATSGGEERPATGKGEGEGAGGSPTKGSRSRKQLRKARERRRRGTKEGRGGTKEADMETMAGAEKAAGEVEEKAGAGGEAEEGAAAVEGDSAAEDATTAAGGDEAAAVADSGDGSKPATAKAKQARAKAAKAKAKAKMKEAAAEAEGDEAVAGKSDQLLVRWGTVHAGCACCVRAYWHAVFCSGIAQVQFGGGAMLAVEYSGTFGPLCLHCCQGICFPSSA